MNWTVIAHDLVVAANRARGVSLDAMSAPASVAYGRAEWAYAREAAQRIDSLGRCIAAAGLVAELELLRRWASWRPA